MNRFQIRNREQIKLLPFYLFVTILVLVSSRFYFFWDKDILNSHQALDYLKNGFSILPSIDTDSGHPPVMGLLLAFLWKIFGKSIFIGHLAMLPFALGLVWQLYRFNSRFIKSPAVYAALLLAIIDTSVLTQVVILTGDLILLFFFFLSVNAILYNKRILLLFALVGLGLSSMRGTMSLVIIGLFDIFYSLNHTDKKWPSRLIKGIALYYLPAFLLTSGYLLYHYLKRGWIGYDPENSQWAGCFEIVNFKGFLRNILILGWRLVDFGRLFLWIAGIYFLNLFVRKKIQADRNTRILIVLLIISLAVYAVPMLIYKIMSGHRYILPVFIIFSSLISYLLFEKIKFRRIRWIIYILLVTGLLSGNFWVYPDKIAKGWDATLAHIPYYKLRKKMIRYIDDHIIPFEKVGSEVPNISPVKYIELTNDNRHFPLKDFGKDEYIFYSNVFNMFTDKEIDELKEKWIPVKTFRKGQVYVELFKNPEYGK